MRVHKQAGMTLVEVALAMAIILIALVPTVNMWVAAVRANRNSQQWMQASQLAQNLLEQKIKDVSYDRQVAQSGTDPATGLTYRLDLLNLSNSRRRVQISITAPGAPEAFVNLVTLVAKEQP